MAPDSFCIFIQFRALCNMNTSGRNTLQPIAGFRLSRDTSEIQNWNPAAFVYNVGVDLVEYVLVTMR